jgi:hypothetical protein
VKDLLLHTLDTSAGAGHKCGCPVKAGYIFRGTALERGSAMEDLRTSTGGLLRPTRRMSRPAVMQVTDREDNFADIDKHAKGCDRKFRQFQAP